MLSKSAKAIKQAVKKGYKIIDGNVFYKGQEVKKRINSSGYYSFSIRCFNKERFVISIHRLMAYQKFGNKIFKKGIQVRHLDSNPLNNLDSNIAIGTPSQNNMDKPEKVRKDSAIKATSFIKTHNHADIIRLHNAGKSYKEIMALTNIKSKGTISFIINNSQEKIKNVDIAELVQAPD